MRSYGQFCALARALDHVGQRWTLLIFRELLLGPKRFTDLRDGLPGIANNLLADRLRQLQDDGLIVQRELPPPAASTVYELTDAGWGLREAIGALIRWGGRWMLPGPRGDEFRPGWLALALDALGLGDRADDGTTLDLHIDGETVHLAIVDRRVVPRRGSDTPADLTVEASATTVLGFAAGAIDADAALDETTLHPDDPETAQIFVRLFASPGIEPASPGTPRPTATPDCRPRGHSLRPEPVDNAWSER